MRVYSDEDFKKMAQCFKECSGSYPAAARLYYLKYGLEPTRNTIKRAVESYNVSESSSVDVDRIISEGSEDARARLYASGDNTYTVIVKEEILNEEDDDHHTLDNTNEPEPIINHLKSWPIVYTTRLDDMIIFNKNFERLDVDDIVDNIISESKPKFNSLTAQNTSQFKNGINPFYRLVENIRKFNELANIVFFSNFENDDSPIIASNQTYKTNINPVEITKQLQIVLEDCRIKPGCTVKVRSNGNTYEVIQIIPTIDNKDDITMESEVGKTNSVAAIGKRKDICIIFLNKNTRSTDIYYINKVKNATNYCCLNRILPKDERPPGYCLVNCCWVRKENHVRSIIASFNNRCPKHSRITLNIMKEPHDCPPGKCICCCEMLPKNLEIESEAEKRVNQREFNYTCKYSVNDEPTWLSTLLTKKSEGNSCITKALKFTKNKDFNEDMSDSNHKKVIPIHIKFKNTKTNMIESYFIESHGDITKYTEIKSADDAANYRLYNATFCQNNDVVCCWRKRDWLLWNMLPKYSQSIINFMTIPHSCQGKTPDKGCNCCCVSLKSFKKSDCSPSLKEQPLLQKLDQAKNYSSKAFVFRKKICLNRIRGSITLKKSSTDMNMFYQTKVVLPHSKSTPSQLPDLSSLEKIIPRASSKPTQSYRKPKKSTPPSSKRRKKVSLEPNLKQPLTLTQGTSITPNPYQTQNVTQIQNPTAVQENPDPTVNSLVQNILNRFRDVRLKITPDGDVSAELNTPIHLLSTAELKILSAILTHAKEQLKSLKANPNMTTASQMFAGSGQFQGIPGLDGLFNQLGPITTFAGGSNTITSPSTSFVNLPSTSKTPVNVPQNVTLINPVSNSFVTPRVGIPNVRLLNPANDPSMPGLTIPPNVPLMNVTTFTPIPNSSNIVRPSNIPMVNLDINSSSPIPRAGPSNVILMNPLNNFTPKMLTTQPIITVNPLKNVNHSQLPKPSSTPYQTFTNISAHKIHQYVQSCRSFLSNKAVGLTPKINNVFSLNETVKNNNFNKTDENNEPTAIVAKVLNTSIVGRKRINIRSNPSLKKAKKDTQKKLVGIEPQNLNPVLTNPVRMESILESTLTSSNPLGMNYVLTKSSNVPSAGESSCSVVPQPMLALSEASLQDLVRAPFVPPPFMSSTSYSGPLVLPKEITCENADETATFPQIKIGPAYSVSEANTLSKEDKKLSKADDECILGF